MSLRASSAVGPLVRITGVSKTFHDGARRSEVLTDVTFELARGSTTSLVGASGSGKSTLMGVLAGLMLPDDGVVLFNGEDTTLLNESARSRLRAQKIGVVVQRGNLIPFLTASENVALAMRLAGRGNRPHHRADTLLCDLGLSGRLSHLPRQLSGGEIQRVALAMALVNEPLLVIGDEMTGELDARTADQVMELVFRESSDRALTLMFVTHDDRLAGMAQTGMRLEGGKIRPA